jgi:hypothetical protein
VVGYYLRGVALWRPLEKGGTQVTVEQVRATLRERIARGATLDELETLLRMTRGLTEHQRTALLTEAWRYDPRRVTRQRVDAVRQWLGRRTRNGSGNGRRRRANRNGRHARHT